MRYQALATDYDGTLAPNGKVDAQTLEALGKLRASGRKLLLVTGRELEDLASTFNEFEIFDRIVAENGALIYDPATQKETTLAQPPPEAFAAMLRDKGVEPISAGRVIVATREPWEQATLETIRDLGLELQVIFNKGAVMVLPSGVNKATGLRCALDELGLSAHNIVAVGDGENDHAFLAACECGVAVEDALAALRERADMVVPGVPELIQMIIDDDMPALSRHDILLGNAGEREIRLPAYDVKAMVTGVSGGGKSTLTTGVLERLAKANYQFCAVDPEGDYQTLVDAVILGDAKKAPVVDEVISVLEKPGRNVVVNMIGVRFDDRPAFFNKLMAAMAELRKNTGRPHWLIVDEAHHVLPAEEEHPADLPRNVLLITMEAEHVHREVQEKITHWIRVGEPLERGQAELKFGDEVVRFEVAEAETPRVRHSRKYAAAELTEDRSFYFRGSEGKLNLRASNLMTFLQLLEGVDDETWTYHLGRGEYSNWFRENIKNKELAGEAERVEKSGGSVEETRKGIRCAVEERYTLPA